MAFWSFRKMNRATLRGKTRAAVRRTILRPLLLEERRLLTATQWTQLGGNAGHTGYVDVDVNAAALASDWTQSLSYTWSGMPPDTAVAIDQNYVYRTDLDGNYSGGNFRILAYDLQTGALVWNKPVLGYGPVTAPSISSGIVYINRTGHSAGSNPDYLPYVIGLDAQTGNTLLQTAYAAQWFTDSRPVIEGGQLYSWDGYYGGFTAYSTTTLGKQWNTQDVFDDPFVALSSQYVYAYNNRIYARSNGAFQGLLVGPTSRPWLDTPIVTTAGRVLLNTRNDENFPNSYGIAAYDDVTHGLLWSVATSDRVTGKAAGNGLVAVTSGTQLAILNEATGAQVRTWTAPAYLPGEIILTRTHVFVESNTSTLSRVHAINLATGNVDWTYQNTLKGQSMSPYMSMAFAGDRLVLSNDAFVQAFAENAAPSITAVALTPTSAYETTTLTATPSGAFDADGDTVTYNYAWYVNGALRSGATTSTLTGASFKKGDSVFARVTPTDGKVLGTAKDSNAVTILNSVPTASINGSFTVVEGASVSLSGSGSDPDGAVGLDWDLDGDGNFGETGSAAERGNETGASPKFLATGLTGPSTASVTLRVRDGDLVATLATASVTIARASIRVTSVAATSTGFVAQFQQNLNPADLNLYDQGNTLGTADVLLTGSASGAVRGSLVVDPGLRKIEFIKSGGLLAADTYTIKLVSGTAAFKDVFNELLDGNGDGTPGDDYTGTFVVSAAAPIVLSVPDITFGQGQAVKVPLGGSGLPISISNAQGVKSASFALNYNPALLTITGATIGADLTGSVTLDTSTPGVAQIVVTSASGLSTTAGLKTLVNLTASVPASAAYSQKHLLNLANVQLLDTSPVPAVLPAIDDDGIHIAAFLGDANGSQTYNAPDATLAQRLIVGTNSGLLAYQLADPYLLVDVNGNGQLQSDDVSQIQRATVGLSTSEILAPSGAGLVAAGGPDPIVSIPQNLTASVGQTISVPVEILVTEPTGVMLAGADLAIRYDAATLELTDTEVGQLLIGFGLSVNSTPGLLRLSLSGSPLDLPHATNGVLATLQFTVLAGEGTTSSINLLEHTASHQTALYDAFGNMLTLAPAPTNAEDDAVDGRVSIAEGAAVDGAFQAGDEEFWQ